MKRKGNSLRIVVGLALLVTLGAALAYWARIGEQEIPFETVERVTDIVVFPRGMNQSYPFSLYLGKEPKLVIITETGGISALENNVSPISQERLNNLDFGQYLAVAVFQGFKPTTEYGVEIKRIVRSGNIITFNAHFTKRDPNLQAGDITTSPYHLVKIQKADLHGEFRFILRADGRVIARQIHRIP